MKVFSISLLVVMAVLFACSFSSPLNFASTGTKPISHIGLDTLLKKHVSVQGNVNYKGFKKDSIAFEKYLSLLTKNPPDDSTWNNNEKLAYWINAYNAFTIKLILNNYPTKSIKNISNPWDKKFFSIGKNKMNLNAIEHEILRKKFNEPRIHFAIVCASYSCPKLLNTAFTAANIEKQLEAQAKDFINDPKRNIITADKVQLSEIFSWFTGDFTKKGTLIAFLNKYSTVKINEKAKVSYLPYNWNLNE